MTGSALGAVESGKQKVERGKGKDQTKEQDEDEVGSDLGTQKRGEGAKRVTECRGNGAKET